MIMDCSLCRGFFDECVNAKTPIGVFIEQQVSVLALKAEDGWAVGPCLGMLTNLWISQHVREQLASLLPAQR
ncbi:MAG: hypothetical protein CK529_11390 [Rhodospirillaceae bacterium]|nr:MAG: hypothetical protein CK529_11390 [Rhodospirillaceae bacterium]